MIKSNIQGKHITHNYSVKYERNDKGGLKAKPRLEVKDEVTYETIMTVDGEIGSNSSGTWSFTSISLSFDCRHRINLSEDEEVIVDNKIYRADLHVYMVHTSKVLSEKDCGKEEAEALLEKLTGEYNEQVINADEKLAAYCKLHKLVLAETDYEELKKVVCPPKCDDSVATLAYVGVTDWAYATSAAIGSHCATISNAIAIKGDD